jgi:hypothetical protein
MHPGVPEYFTIDMQWWWKTNAATADQLIRFDSGPWPIRHHLLQEDA